MEKKQSKFKGYFLTVACGLVVIAGTLFLILQHPPDLMAKVSVYGEYKDIKTIWVIAISALIGPLFLLCCWWLLRGVWILYTIRRGEARHVKAADAALARAQAKGGAALASPARTEGAEAPESPTPSADEPAHEPAPDGDGQTPA